jgi:hypothetical protein
MCRKERHMRKLKKVYKGKGKRKRKKRKRKRKRKMKRKRRKGKRTGSWKRERSGSRVV